jgi:capsular exopolysaccharide synthesis family protein
MSERVELDLRSWVQALRRRAWLVVLTAVAAGVLALGYSLLQDPRYQASAELLFRQANEAERVVQGSAIDRQSDPARSAATNLALASNDDVLLRLKRTLRTSKNVEDLRKEFALAPAGQADIVRVTAEASSPNGARRLADIYAGQVVAVQRDAAIARVQVGIDALSRRIADAGPTTAVGRALDSRRLELEVLQALQTGNVELASRAVTPLHQSSPKTLRNSIVGVLLGGIIGFVLALLVARFDQRVRTDEEVVEIFGAPILARVPELGKAAWQRQMFLEAFQFLRTNLQFDLGERVDSGRLLAVTSPSPGDGKSTVAANLSEAFASGSTRVLAVDCDLRKPGLAAAFSLPDRRNGVAELLMGLTTLDQAAKNLTSNLNVILAGSRGRVGHMAPHPPASAIADLFETLRDAADVVIVDTAPVGIAAETSTIAALADSVIVVVDARNLRRDALRATNAQLRQAGARIAGVVLNHVDTPRHESAYAGYYGTDHTDGTPVEPDETSAPVRRA